MPSLSPDPWAAQAPRRLQEKREGLISLWDVWKAPERASIDTLALTDQVPHPRGPSHRRQGLGVETGDDDWQLRAHLYLPSTSWWGEHVGPRGERPALPLSPSLWDNRRGSSLSEPRVPLSRTRLEKIVSDTAFPTYTVTHGNG